MDYSANFRVIYQNKNAKFFTNTNKILLKDEFSFDLEFDEISAVDSFVGGICSGVILSIAKELKRQKIEFDDLESSVKISLENPLTFLNIKGYDESPKITKIEMKIYIYADTNFENLSQICSDELQNHSSIIQSKIY